jgi:hypothetical protein
VAVRAGLNDDLQKAIGKRLGEADGFATLRTRWEEYRDFCDRRGRTEDGKVILQGDDTVRVRRREPLFAAEEDSEAEDGEEEQGDDEIEEIEDDEGGDYAPTASPKTRRGRTVVKTEKAIGKQKDDGQKKTRKDLTHLKAYDAEKHLLRVTPVSSL